MAEVQQLLPDTEPYRAVTMVVKGPGVDLKVDLPRNVSTAQLLDQLRPLLDEGGQASGK